MSIGLNKSGDMAEIILHNANEDPPDKDTSWFHRSFGPKRSVKRSKSTFMIGAFLPVLIAFLVIRVIPIFWVLSLSVTNYSLKKPKVKFVGLKNFIHMLDDPLMVVALKNTLEFVIISVPCIIIFGLLFALLINRKLKLEGLYQTLYFLPFILSYVPTTIIWKWIYSPGSYGLANYLLEAVGLMRVKWLTDPKITILAIIFVYIWKNIGYYIVIFLVGFKNIPSELREAAEVDGANTWQASRFVELPLMKPLILFGTVYATISGMAIFTLVYVMSQGTDVSTGVEISVLAMRIYQEGFGYSDMGYASAISTFLFIFSLIIVVLQFKLFGKE